MADGVDRIPGLHVEAASTGSGESFRCILFPNHSETESDSMETSVSDEIGISRSQSFHSLDMIHTEKYLINKLCREFLEYTGDVDPQICDSNVFTPYSWVMFRDHINKLGRLQIDSQIILIKKEGILLRYSTMMPICDHPSCYSTEIALNRRCGNHRGDTTSFSVLELVFRERVLGIDVAIGVEHVNLMFSHWRRDSLEERKRRILEEYEYSGLMKDTWNRLLKIKFKRAAEELRRSKLVAVRRFWIFDTAQEASNHFYIVAKAASHVYKKLDSNVVPAGEFKGQHVEIVRPHCLALEGVARFDFAVKSQLCKDINKEQLATYGTAEKIRFCY